MIVRKLMIVQNWMDNVELDGVWTRDEDDIELCIKSTITEINIIVVLGS